MIELIIIGFVFWLGYQVGLSVMSFNLRHLIYQEAKRRGLINDVDKTDSLDVSQLVIEKANNILYLYERDTYNFICQGSTLDELATLAQKYKNIKYAAVLNGEEVYAFVNGSVKTDQEVLKNES